MTTSIIALYAATLSTIVFSWQVFTYFQDRIVKIKVDVSMAVEQIIHGSTGSLTTVIFGTVTNVGRAKRVVDIPLLSVLIEKPKFERTIVDYDCKDGYPKTLEPGDQVSRKILLTVIEDDLKRNKYNSYWGRVVVRDTHGKTYKSGWICIRDSKK